MRVFKWEISTQYVVLTFLSIMAIGGSYFAYKTFFYKPPTTGIYSQPQPATNAPVQEVQVRVVYVYDKKKASSDLKLPVEIVNDERKQVTATAKLKPSEGGYTVASVIDTSTGKSEITAKEEAVSWLGLGGKSEIGALGGITTAGDAALLYAKQDLLRIGKVNLGVVGGGGTVGGKLGAGAFVNVGFKW